MTTWTTHQIGPLNLDIPHLVAWKVVEENDIQCDTVWERAEGPIRPHHAQYQGGIALIRDMTPEERYDKMLAWVRRQLKTEVSQ